FGVAVRAARRALGRACGRSESRAGWLAHVAAPERERRKRRRERPCDVEQHRAAREHRRCARRCVAGCRRAGERQESRKSLGTAGAPLGVSVALSGGQWWDLPRLRVKEFGWAEIRDGAKWARITGHDSAFAAPGARVADQLLAAALQPDKAAYFRIIDSWITR